MGLFMSMAAGLCASALVSVVDYWTLAGCGKGLPQPAAPLCNLPQRGRTKHYQNRRRSELTSPRGANQKGSNPALSQGGEDF